MKDQHKRFAILVRDGMPQGKAAVEVGYSRTSSHTQAYQLMKRQDVIAIVRGTSPEVDPSESVMAKAGINARYILSEILDNAQKAKNQAKPDYKASTSAYALLAKHLNLFIDRTEVTQVNQVKDYLDLIINIIDQEIKDPGLRARMVVRLAEIKDSFN